MLLLCVVLNVFHMNRDLILYCSANAHILYVLRTENIRHCTIHVPLLLFARKNQCSDSSYAKQSIIEMNQNKPTVYVSKRVYMGRTHKVEQKI